ncbi:MAG: hypothetical protein QXX08_11565 [Candidatus Bathyarchaeia archaeon]
MKVAETTSLLAFAKQNEVASKSLQSKQSTDKFLSEYISCLKDSLQKEGKWQLFSDFFVLGRASFVLMVKSIPLFENPKVIGAINQCYLKCRRKSGAKVGAFSIYSYPVIEAILSEENKGSFAIPALLFIRSSIACNKMREILDQPELRRYVRSLFYGLGMHNVIIYISCPTLCAVRDVVQKVRQTLDIFWETQTIIGIPKDSLRDVEKNSCYHKFSFVLSAKCQGHIDNQMMNDIQEVIGRHPHLFIDQNTKMILSPFGLRQGAMDIDIAYQTSSVSEAFEFALDIRKINRIVDTSTTARLDVVLGEQNHGQP